MSIFSAMNGNSFTPNAFGRILVFLICSVAMLLSTSAAMGLSTGYMYEFRVASLVMALAYALALIMCLKEDWFTSCFFGGVCVVLMASLAGEFTSLSLINAMKAKSLEPLLIIPAAVFVGGLPLLTSQIRSGWGCRHAFRNARQAGLLVLEDAGGQDA